ncbi:hypothetical protein [Nonomuraea sp. NPDC048826]|uniref:hypothetical protein n=1 Tax=Nonomuraea sp. NPDC048826 TaxID=3364347 RepID=UPI003722CC5A
MAAAIACLSLAVVAVPWAAEADSRRIHWTGPDIGVLGVEKTDDGALAVALRIEVEYQGIGSFTLTGLSADIPGMRLLPVNKARDETGQVTVESGSWETLRRTVVITDCEAVPREPQPIRFTYRTWLGDGEGQVVWHPRQLPEESVTVAWQRGIAIEACDEAVERWS